MHCLTQKFSVISQKYFSNLTAEAFEKHKVAYAVRRSQKPKTVLEKAQSLWSEILLESYNFERQEVELAEIPKITLEEFLNYFRVSCSNKLRFIRT